MNNAEVSIEYVETLSRSLSIDIAQSFPNIQGKEKAKIESCLAGMKSASFTLRTVVDYGLEQLRVSAVKPRVTPWVDVFLTINHQVNDVIFSLYIFLSRLRGGKTLVTFIFIQSLFFRMSC